MPADAIAVNVNTLDFTYDSDLTGGSAAVGTAGSPSTSVLSVQGVTSGTPQPVLTKTVTTATLANVNGSASSVTVLASNSAARGRAVKNDSAAVLYLKFGATASTTSYTVDLAPGAYYEFPSPLYTGIVDGIWASATGAARTTEW